MGFVGFIVGLIIAMFLKIGWFGLFIPFIMAAFFQKMFKKQPSFTQPKQEFFLIMVFEVLGHLSKAKGVVTTNDITLANRLMREMDLNAQGKRLAQDAFTRGKEANYPLDIKIAKLKSAYRYNVTLLRWFLECQIMAALSDGNIHPNEMAVLQKISRGLGFNDNILQQLLRYAQYSSHNDGHNYQSGYQGQQYSYNRQQNELDECYSVLDVSASDDPQTIKRAYRKLMSQNHPDKLVSKGLPPEMIEMAKKKTQAIQAAYEKIKQARGFS